MAATVSPWAKPGAWALDSEEHEDELLNQPPHKAQEDNTYLHREPEQLADFPSLSAAAATKSKKKKSQTLSLAEFTTYSAPKPAQSSTAKGLTHQDLMMLPTGPRERTAEELDRTRLGGGFRSYGSNGSFDRNSRYSNGEDSSNSRWGSSSRVSDENRRPGGFGRDSSRESAPSRADEIDDWAAAKKSPVGNGFERKERGGGGGFFDSQSKADESDNWASNKTFVPSEGRRFGGTSGGGGGGGFDRERRGGGFESFTNGSGADSESWGKKKEEGSGNTSGSGSGSGSGGRPRLNLQPRTVPVSNGQQQGPGTIAKPKGSNPFGEARPREEVLAEKGQDWKKIDEQLESMKIKEAGADGAGATDGPSFGKRNFGSGNGRASSTEARTEMSWRKPESVDVRPTSAEKSENELTEEN